jgi:hypothetical protein
MCAVLSLGSSVPRVVGAQRVLGIGEDATVLPKGGLRVSTSASWSAYNELYGPGGQLQSLGAPLSSDSLGAKQLEALRPLETRLRDLAQLPRADVSLGAMRTDFTARITRTALTFDLGLTSRIMLTATVPYVHTYSEVVMDVNPRNEPGTRANLGVNPALGTVGNAAAAQNRDVVDSLLRVIGDLKTRLGTCTGGGGADPVCADQARAQALLNDATAFASGVAKTYGIGADTALGAPYIPMANSALQTAIAARVAGFNTSFKNYFPDLAGWKALVAAQAPISSGQATALLSQSLGVGTIGLVERSHLGDIEVGAKILLIDTFGGAARARAAGHRTGIRIAVGGLARLGTGQIDRPDEIADVGTGDGQTDVEGNGIADIILGRRLWASFVARVGVQLPDEKLIRIPDVARNPFVAAYRERLVSRDLGDYTQFEATPRFVYNDYLSASAQWLYRRKGEDKYTGAFTATDSTGQSTALDASILGIGTQQTEQRITAGVTFSTLRAFDRGRARLPVEIQLQHSQVLSGTGYLPKQFGTQIQIRYYTRLFGAPMRPPAASAPST